MSGRPKRLYVISTLGDYQNYDEVEYTIGDKRVKSRTSLAALIERAKEEYNSDMISVLVLVPDTLIAKIESPESGDTRSYTDIAEIVENDARSWLEGNIDIGGVDLRVGVVPNIGEFGRRDGEKRWRFRLASTSKDKRGRRPPAPVDLFGSFLIRYAMELPGIFEEPASFWLDITHGINYMPMAAYDLVLLIAYAHSLSMIDNVELRVFQSEPHVRGKGSERSGTKRLNIYEPIAHKITYLRASAALTGRLGRLGLPQNIHLIKILAQIVNIKEKLQKIHQIKEKSDYIRNKGEAAVGALISSAVLAAAYLAAKDLAPKLVGNDNGVSLKPVVSEAIELSLSTVRVERSGNETIVEWRIVPRLDDLQTLLIYASVGTHIYRATELVPSAMGSGDISIDERGLSLKELEKMLGRFGSTNTILAKNEISTIRTGCRGDRAKGDCNCKEKKGPKCFIEIGEEWPGLDCKRPDMRNFFAHAGLESNVVEARLDDKGEIWIRYRKGCFEREVLGVLGNIAREILG